MAAQIKMSASASNGKGFGFLFEMGCGPARR